MRAAQAFQANRRSWDWVPIAYTKKPLLSTTDKGEAYDVANARCFLASQNDNAFLIDFFRWNYFQNLLYCTDSKWGEGSDEQMFLGDKRALTTRIPFKNPIMSPMLTRMIGGADGISINATLEPLTRHFETRREIRLNEALAMSMAAQQDPMVASALGEMGISTDMGKTRQQVIANYNDEVIAATKDLMRVMGDRAGLDDMKREVAGYMAMSGISAIHSFVNGTRIEKELCEPSEVGWTMSAIRSDFSDAPAHWLCPLMDVSAICERWPDKKEELDELDKWASTATLAGFGGGGWPQDRPRVYTVYYKDREKCEMGYVMVDGEPDLVQVDAINPDTGKPKYKESDIVAPPENMYTLEWTSEEKRRKRKSCFKQVMRYCTFIPWEYFPVARTKNVKFGATDQYGAVMTNDLVLDSGICPLQEQDPNDVFGVLSPLKFKAWRYFGGYVVAPMSAARDPQRWMNQITSDLAYRLRTAGGKSLVLGKNAMADGGMTEQQILLANKEGEPVVMGDAGPGGLQGAASVLDTSPAAGFYQLFGTLPATKEMADNAVNVFPENYGAPTGPNQLVGTMQLQLQQAGVAQQPFYASIADLFKQVHQHDAQAGRQHYARYPVVLRKMVGDAAADAILLTKDDPTEYLRAKVDLTADTKQLRVMTDRELVPMLMQMGMLDPVAAAQLLGRATPDDAYDAARQFTQQQAIAAEEAAQQQAMQQQAAMLDAEAAEIDMAEANLAKDQTRAEIDMAKIEQKLMQPEAQAAAAWNKPDAFAQAAGGTLP